jgi:hypothetical protein
MNRLLLYLWLSALTFLAGVAVCMLLDPTAIISHSGFSYYGNLRRTIIPYGLSIVGSAYFLIRACQLMKSTAVARSFRVGLEGIAVALLGIVATPSLAAFSPLQDLHVLFGLFIYAAQAALSLHFLIHVRGAVMDWFLLCCQLAAVVLAVLSFHAVNMLSVMLPAQLLAVCSFGALLIRAATYRTNHQPAA